MEPLLIKFAVSFLVFSVGKTERLEKHIHTDLQTKVTYQPQDQNQT